MNPTTTVRQSDKDTIEVPHWMRGMDPATADRALQGFDVAIADLKKAHERTIERCLMHAWFDPFGDGSALLKLMHIRQHLAVAVMLRERMAKLIELMRSQAA